MNRPPQEFIRVPHGRLCRFASQAMQAVGLSTGKAELLGDLLSGNDLRGVFSHGTYLTKRYAVQMRGGRLNHSPSIQVVKETPTSLMVDGDGGLGYFPAYDGTRQVIEKAKAQGIAVMVSRNHGHIGSAGLYTRMALAHDLMAYVTSGHQVILTPGASLSRAGGGPPMSFGAPADEEDDLVLDFGVMNDVYEGSPHFQDILRMAPGLVMRSIGLGEIGVSWGGLLSGLTVDHDTPRWHFPAADQGSTVIAFRIDLFVDPIAFKREIDQFVRRVRDLKPLEGFDRTYLAGGVEAARERQYRVKGVPVGPDHRQALQEVAELLAIPVPW